MKITGSNTPFHSSHNWSQSQMAPWLVIPWFVCWADLLSLLKADLSSLTKYLCYSHCVNKQLETLFATPFTSIGIHERINKNQTDLRPWPINMLSRPFIRVGCTLQPLQNEQKHLQKNPWHQTLWHRQYCSEFSTYHASPPILEVAYFNCCKGKVADDIPASRGRHAVLQRALQKTTVSVPFKKAHKIAVDISMIKGPYSHKYSIWCRIVCGCRKPTPKPTSHLKATWLTVR